MKLGQITGVLMAAAIVLSGITTTGVDAAEPCEDSSKCSTEQINDVDEGETGLEDELSTYSDSNIPHQNQHVVVHSADEYFTIFARTYNAN